MSGEFWSIAGTSIQVTDSTVVQSDVPITVGTFVAAAGTVSADGTRIATNVVAGSAVIKLRLVATSLSEGPGSVSASPPNRPTSSGRIINLPLVLHPSVAAGQQ